MDANILDGDASTIPRYQWFILQTVHEDGFLGVVSPDQGGSEIDSGVGVNLRTLWDSELVLIDIM